MSKKTETLELRLPYETKQAFMARCRDAGRSASEELRGFIASYLEGGARKRDRKRLAIRIGLVIGALIAATAVAEPALARASVSASFAQIDANHDGEISFAEFSRAARPEIALDVGPTLPLAESRRLSPDLKARILRESFDRIDADRNGKISLREFRRYAGR
ncbi:MAG TPA: EF-hand domain-containing protein [Caulobacteraceae bacterium]|jgi:hypothetical protein|nr:EF-hand domain-containing protein [Caulobacteraceae bacterium]